MIAVLLVGQPVGMASAHPDTGKWRMVHATVPSYQTALRGAAATGAGDQWAVGYSFAPGLGYQPIIERSDGRTWRRMAPPPGPYKVLRHVDASSSDNVWVFGEDWDASPHQSAAMRWDGSRWSVTRLPGDPLVGDAAVVSARAVWLIAVAGGTNGGGVMHFNGRRWSKAQRPTNMYELGIDAVSSRDAWVVGGAKGQPATMHWDGRRWKAVPTPRYRAPEGGSASLHSVTALSRKDVYAVGAISYECDEDQRCFRPIAMHWNGRAWSKISVPVAGVHLQRVVPDGRGGVWALAFRPWSGGADEVLNYRAGRWSLHALPLPPSTSSTSLGVYALAHVPGTPTTLAVGETSPLGTETEYGVIYAGEAD